MSLIRFYYYYKASQVPPFFLFRQQQYRTMKSLIEPGRTRSSGRIETSGPYTILRLCLSTLWLYVYDLGATLFPSFFYVFIDSCRRRDGKVFRAFVNTQRAGHNKRRLIALA